MAIVTNHLGPISSEQVYPLEVFAKLTGLGAWGMRKARRAGLKVKTVGRRRYVRGIDWHEFLAERSRP
jgi:hypothetical protein